MSRVRENRSRSGALLGLLGGRALVRAVRLHFKGEDLRGLDAGALRAMRGSPSVW